MKWFIVNKNKCTWQNKLLSFNVPDSQKKHKVDYYFFVAILVSP